MSTFSSVNDVNNVGSAHQTIYRVREANGVRGLQILMTLDIMMMNLRPCI